MLREAESTELSARRQQHQDEWKDFLQKVGVIESDIDTNMTCPTIDPGLDAKHAESATSSDDEVR